MSMDIVASTVNTSEKTSGILSIFYPQTLSETFIFLSALSWVLIIASAFVPTSPQSENPDFLNIFGLLFLMSSVILYFFIIGMYCIRYYRFDTVDFNDESLKYVNLIIIIYGLVFIINSILKTSSLMKNESMYSDRVFLRFIGLFASMIAMLISFIFYIYTENNIFSNLIGPFSFLFCSIWCFIW